MTPTAVLLCPCVDDLSVAKETRIDNIGLCVDYCLEPIQR